MTKFEMWSCVGASLLVVFLAAPGWASDEEEEGNDTCFACHSMEDLATEAGKSLFVDTELFDQSTHAGLTCTTCHDDAAVVPHEEPPKQVPLDTCAMCHGEVVEAYKQSIHGEARANGAADAATCSSCHDSPHRTRKVADPASPVYPLNLPRTCGKCHGDPDLAERHGIPVADAYQLYMDSIHGRALTRSGLLVAANCSSCHGFHGIRPRDEAGSKVFRANIPSTCGECHAGVQKEYEEGIHGHAVQSGNEKAPVCIDCHTAHRIARVDTSSWKLRIVSECGTCHEESLHTYRDTLHGQVTALGFTRIARCSDCHGSHRVFPGSNAQSSIAPANIVATCQKCHPNANENFAEFSPHADHKDQGRYPSLYYTALLMNVLIVGVFAFFGTHTLLWFGRSLIEQRKSRNGRGKSAS